MDAKPAPRAEAAEATGTPETALGRNVWAHFGGPVTGQIAIGDSNILIDRSPGAYVKVTNTSPPSPRPRPGPVRLPPRDFPQLLGREFELGRASRALMAAETVEFHAQSGWGKSVLMRHLSCHLPRELTAEGLVFLDAGGQYQDDLLQVLFDTFYTTDVPFKPSKGQLRHYLADLRAVLSFDDLDLDREQLTALTDMVPNCLILAASETRTLWGEGEAIPLAGLPEEAALALLERELGRPLAASERHGAIDLCRRVAGQPQAILQAAALVRERRDSRAPLGILLADAENGSDISLKLVGSLQPAARVVLGILASQQGAALTRERVARVSRLDGVDEILQSLAEKGLVELTPTGWRLIGLLSPALASLLSTDTWAAAVIDEVADWIEEQQGHPSQIAWEGELVVHTAESARRSKAWQQLRRLARGASSALLLSGLWDAWAVLLQEGLEAAQQLQDQATEAWCLHQLGTRALCLGDTGVAAELLREALAIRRSLGDREGIAVTRHNLGLIGGPGSPWWTHGKILAGGLAALLAVLGAGFAVGHYAMGFPGPGAGQTPSPTPNPTPVSSSAPSLSPGRLDFGQITLAGQANRQLIVSNPGESEITLGPISVDGEFQQVSGCPATLTAHGQCTLDVTFRPTATHRATATLTLAYGSGGRRTVQLSGEGVAPHLTLDPPAVEFRNLQVGRTSASTTVHLRNPEAVPVGITRIGTDGDFAVEGRCISGPLQLGPSEACDLAVTFKPTTRGTRRGHLSVKGDVVTESVQLTGFGGIVDLRFAPAPLDMGSQSVGLPGKVSSVTLSNAGDVPFVAAKLVGTNEFSASGCQQVLQPNASCQINVSFTPKQGDLRSGNLQVIDDTGSVGSQLALTGTGLVPNVTIKPDSVYFVGYAPYKTTVRVTNEGPGTLLIRSVSAPRAPFRIIDDSCSKSPLAQNQSCDVTAQFDLPTSSPPPNQSTLYKATLVFEDNGIYKGNRSPHEVPLTCDFLYDGHCD